MSEKQQGEPEQHERKAVWDALHQFFAAQKTLNQLGVIHSRDYIGDIGRYLCRAVYGMQPAEKAGYDGIVGGSRVLVRINNCPTGTPVRVGAPRNFDELIVVLGPNSWLRPAGAAAGLLFYRFTQQEVLEQFQPARKANLKFAQQRAAQQEVGEQPQSGSKANLKFAQQRTSRPDTMEQPQPARAANSKFAQQHATRPEVGEQSKTLSGLYIGGKEVFAQGIDRVSSLASDSPERKVLFLHGFASSSRGTKGRFFTERFEASPQVTFQALDFSPTITDFEYLTVTGMIDRLRQHVLGRGWGEISLVGSSMGALVGLNYAHRFGGVHRMLLLAPALSFGFGKLEEVELLEKEASLPFYHYAYEREIPLQFSFFRDGQGYLEPAPPAAPTLIVHGRHDAVIPIAESRAYADRYDQVRLLEVDSDHTLNDHLPFIWEQVGQFLLS